ncbi:MAG: hypothetical protein IK081_09070 [Lachnospiraceae bacterium]|nr:hypothetical protein [Lachnospiraceae bacterium]
MNGENAMTQGISRNLLKLIAIITITIGHFFLYTFTTFRAFGLGKPWIGIACYVCFVGPPIFMFFISEGFQYTSSKIRYGKRLLIFALITQVAHAVTADSQLGFSFKTFFFEWNVFFTLLFGFIDLCILTSEKKWIVKITGVLAVLTLSYLMNTEWWVFGQLIIIAYYYLRKNRVLKFIVVSLLIYFMFVFSDCNFGGDFVVCFYTRGMRYYMPFSVIGVALPSFFYKGRNGKKSKFLQYFFYVFYPLHLLLIDASMLLAG